MWLGVTLICSKADIVRRPSTPFTPAALSSSFLLASWRPCTTKPPRSDNRDQHASSLALLLRPRTLSGVSATAGTASLGAVAMLETLSAVHNVMLPTTAYGRPRKLQGTVTDASSSPRKFDGAKPDWQIRSGPSYPKVKVQGLLDEPRSIEQCSHRCGSL
jgi:hypothetical protein